MNISDKIPHGKIGHMCKGGCVGYAGGGVVDKKPESVQEANNRNLEELGLPTRGSAGSEQLKNAIPLIGLLRALGQNGEVSKRTSDPGFLRNTVGKALETNYQRGAPWDTFGKEADAQMMSKGGKVEEEEDHGEGPTIGDEKHGEASLPEGEDHGEGPTVGDEEHGIRGYAEGGTVGKAASDEVDIPEDVKEFVSQQHIARQESRPDEAWKMVGEKPTGDEIPYKRDEDDGETPEEPVVDHLPGYAEGGMVDPNDLLGQIAPAGTGLLSPSPAPQPPDQAPIPAPPIAPMAAPKAPISTGPAPTDADYMAKANKLLGLDANQTASFMKMLGDRSQKAQLGAGIAGIGDAIASGGTLGKVNPGALNKSEELISNRENAGVAGMQTIRGNQEKAQELGDKLQSRDPKSPLSKYAQRAYAGVGKKIGLDLSNAPASLIADVTGKGVDALNTEMLNQMKLMQLDLQKKTLEATTANQKSERDIATAGRRSEAAKALAGRSTLQSIAGAIPFTAANKAKSTLESEMNMGNYGPDVLSYAQKHGISPEEAQSIKDKRTKG